MISGVITTTANNQGILNFKGNFTSSNTIGTNSSTLNTLNIQGGTGTTINLMNNTYVGSGNINFTGNAKFATLSIGNNVTMGGNLATSNANTGTLTFQGNNTFAGTIGSGNAIYALNVQGTGSIVNLQGTTNVRDREY